VYVWSVVKFSLMGKLWMGICLQSTISLKMENSMEEKSAYQEKFEARLKEWKAKIEQLEARAGQVKADAKIEYQEKIRELKEKEKAARSKLEELKKGGSEAWRELKGGLEKAGDDLKAAIEKAVSKFK
jgi:hypothetical protein